MPITVQQLSNLKELRDNIPETLEQYFYFSSKSNCYCVVGHMLSKCGVENERLEKLGFDSIVDHYVLAEKIKKHYGLSLEEQIRLQGANDYPVAGTSSSSVREFLTCIVEQKEAELSGDTESTGKPEGTA